MSHRLPEQTREVVHLRLFGDFSFREIGDITGKNENWARVTYYRGIVKLREEARVQNEEAARYLSKKRIVYTDYKVVYKNVNSIAALKRRQENKKYIKYRDSDTYGSFLLPLVC